MDANDHLAQIANHLKEIPAATLRQIADENELRDENARREVERDAARREEHRRAYNEQARRASRVGRINHAIKLLRSWQYEESYPENTQERRNAKIRDEEMSARLDEARKKLRLARLHEGEGLSPLEQAVTAYEKQLADHRRRHENDLKPVVRPTRREHYESFVRSNPPTILDELVAKILEMRIEDLPDDARVVAFDRHTGKVKTLGGSEHEVMGEYSESRGVIETTKLSRFF